MFFPISAFSSSYWSSTTNKNCLSLLLKKDHSISFFCKLRLIRSKKIYFLNTTPRAWLRPRLQFTRTNFNLTLSSLKHYSKHLRPHSNKPWKLPIFTFEMHSLLSPHHPSKSRPLIGRKLPRTVNLIWGMIHPWWGPSDPLFWINESWGLQWKTLIKVKK